MVAGQGTLAGRVAIVTGGGTGLVKTMALFMAKEGADVVVASRRTEVIEPAAQEMAAFRSSQHRVLTFSLY